jgi:RimJ/RimL family protein N-acetyltransferase
LNVLIRPYRLDDAEAVVEAVRESIAELQPWMPWCHPGYSLADSRSWLEIQVPAFVQRTAFEFAIVSAEGRYLGGCGLNQIDKANNWANLGYWVRSGATRQGAATAAVCKIRDWAFQTTDLIRLEIVVAVGNLPSHRVAEKVGAVREGTLHRRILLHGAARDATMFSLTRDIPTSQNRAGAEA